MFLSKHATGMPCGRGGGHYAGPHAAGFVRGGGIYGCDVMRPQNRGGVSASEVRGASLSRRVSCLRTRMRILWPSGVEAVRRVLQYACSGHPEAKCISSPEKLSIVTLVSGACSGVMAPPHTPKLYSSAAP